MRRLVLPALPLTKAAFRPFGDVIETAGADRLEINDGMAKRYHDLAHVDVEADGGKPLINIFEATMQSLPLRIELMERHPLGSQAFVPLSDSPWLAIVAPALEDGAPGKPEVFRPSPGQGINYGRGVWHHPLVALEATEFLVVDRGGSGGNLEIFRWKTPRFEAAAG